MTSGCPNHYSVCTAKGHCSNGVGTEGTATEAKDQSKTIEVPAKPVIAANVTDITCELGSVAVALNGVSIYAGAVDQRCGELGARKVASWKEISQNVHTPRFLDFSNSVCLRVRYSRRR